ncbi:MAG: energy-coupling factor transporter transmembrane protein EcfT [Firmicutes bacterium]|nr:energy-coupling factor transporter transmembrane protein EcfT [Bacillota bacterium]
MLKNISIGQYYPGDSVVHRLDPRTKLTLSFAFIVVLFIVKGFLAYLWLAALVLVAAQVAGVPLKVMLRGLRPLKFIIALTFFLHLFTTRGGAVLWEWQFLRVESNGLVQGTFLAFRLMLLVVATSLLTLTTSPIALTDGLERILSPGAKVGLPAHELAMMMTIALRFIPTLIDEADKIMRAQLARGADFESGGLVKRAKSLLPLLVPLFVSAFRRADELAMAMEARAYRGGEHRTRLKVLKYSRNDFWAYCLAGLAFATAYFLGRWG